MTQSELFGKKGQSTATQAVILLRNERGGEIVRAGFLRSSESNTVGIAGAGQFRAIEGVFVDVYGLNSTHFYARAQGSEWNAQVNQSVRIPGLLEEGAFPFTATTVQLSVLLTTTQTGSRFEVWISSLGTADFRTVTCEQLGATPIQVEITDPPTAPPTPYTTLGRTNTPMFMVPPVAPETFRPFPTASATAAAEPGTTSTWLSSTIPASGHHVPGVGAFVTLIAAIFAAL